MNGKEEWREGGNVEVSSMTKQFPAHLSPHLALIFTFYFILKGLLLLSMSSEKLGKIRFCILETWSNMGEMITNCVV